MVLFAFPPLIAGTILLELERAFGWPFFNASLGGDAVLWQHLFWIFGHPEVYIIFLPSVALIAMIVPTAVRRPLVGYSWIVLSAIGTGFLSFGLWVHHMFTTGLPGVTLAIFSAASMAVAIPNRHPDLLLHRHAARRHRDAIGADALHHRRPVDLRDRRTDRRDGGDGALQLPGARHLLRRRAPAHRADRRSGVSR